MKNLLLGSVIITGLIIGGPGYSADLPMKAAPPPPIVAPAYSWTGCYIGGHIGGGFGRKDWSTDPSDTGDFNSIIASAADERGSSDLGSHVITGLLGGAQGGCDYQFSFRLILGAQADFSLASLKGSHTDAFTLPAGTHSSGESFTAKTDVDRLGTITGRIGYSYDRALFYLKGGAAWVHDKYSMRDFEVSSNAYTEITTGEASPTRWGWTVGAGFEYALIPNLSAFIEYDYLDFGNSRVTFRCLGQAGFPGFPLSSSQTLCGGTPSNPNTTLPLDIRQQVHEIKLGLNYRFNWGKVATPVVARY